MWPAILEESFVKARTSPFLRTKVWSLGIPVDWAVSVWTTCILYSPWTGMKYSGLVNSIIIFCSSCPACPEVWTLWILPWTTLAPASVNLLIKWFTLVVLPGIGLEEKMTVSPGCNEIWRWVPSAILERAARGSPWEPVHKIIAFSGGVWLISLASTKVPSGISK